MTKLYGMLAYACGSIAIATLVLGIMVGGGRQAWANECGCGVQPPGTFGDPAYDTWYHCMMTCSAAVDCSTCTCSVAPCADDSCSGGDSCRTGCSCGDKAGGGCKCS